MCRIVLEYHSNLPSGCQVKVYILSQFLNYQYIKSKSRQISMRHSVSQPFVSHLTPATGLRTPPSTSYVTSVVPLAFLGALERPRNIFSLIGPNGLLVVSHVTRGHRLGGRLVHTSWMVPSPLRLLGLSTSVTDSSMRAEVATPPVLVSKQQQQQQQQQQQTNFTLFYF